ncbi:MAG: ABC transporter ATP-binding protein [Bacillota bacterium]|nr:ATP-binding cassette domain-containing protein [Bacillota bacterium]NLU54362.1 ATP-binding cassette domain-containing protein [Bacillota bacterium]HOA91420.1 ATP-binding cassette domain-containing protein [Bacillota bacterium]HOL13688.1 ATP-binding cassette domain-containing protein [Bacillota bacterium]HOP54479.1 ATP-binding cassette domain-containing protein [Bacillota bacterium]
MEFKLESVSLQKQEKTILSSISLEIPAGSIFILIGPSGSGKSSLLRLLNRLDAPTSGRILYKDQPIESYPVQELRKEVGMLFQHPVMINGTVRDNIALGHKLQKKDLPEEKVLELIERVGLEKDLIDKDASVLSGGQKQRVALARTLANDPKVLLLDEPTSALDPGAVVQVRETLIQQAKRGITLVWVTHDMDVASDVATGGALLVGGKIVVQGGREELFEGKNQIAQTFLKGELKENE